MPVGAGYRHPMPATLYEKPFDSDKVADLSAKTERAA